MGETSSLGKKYLMLAVDRATKFLFALSLATRKALSVAGEPSNLVLSFGLPLSIRSDLGMEFTAVGSAGPSLQLAQRGHSTRTSRPRQSRRNGREGARLSSRGVGRAAQGVTKEVGRVRTVCARIHRATPDPRCPAQNVPFNVFFGRKSRKQLNAANPVAEDIEVRKRLYFFISS